MNLGILKFLAPLSLTALVGCFTLTESPYPETVMTRPAMTNATLSVKGFDATVTELVTVTGVQTVWIDGSLDGWGGRWYGPGYWESVPITATMARPASTDLFRERARTRFEESGWRTMAQTPDYVVEVRFSGPAEGTSVSSWARAFRVLGTLFFSDRAVLAWEAKLRIYDNRTGELLFMRDYIQTDEESMWSLVPIFGPIAYEKTDADYLRLRCLYALTDRVTADASSYLAGGHR